MVARQELDFVLHRGERLQAVDVSAAAAAVEPHTPDHWVRGARGEELGDAAAEGGGKVHAGTEHLRSGGFREGSGKVQGRFREGVPPGTERLRSQREGIEPYRGSVQSA